MKSDFHFGQFMPIRFQFLSHDILRQLSSNVQSCKVSINLPRFLYYNEFVLSDNLLLIKQQYQSLLKLFEKCVLLKIRMETLRCSDVDECISLTVKSSTLDRSCSYNVFQVETLHHLVRLNY